MKALALLVVGMLCSPSLQAGPVQDEDPALQRIKETIEKTTPEGKETIERVRRMLPEVNGQVSAQPLERLIEVFAKERGERNLTPIGWTAAIKRSGRWKILFYYQDFDKQYKAAEWEYNPEEVSLYPFDLINATQFWAGTPDRK